MTVSFDDEESVYQLIPEEVQARVKPPMYRSTHDYRIPPSYSTFGTSGTSKKVGNPSGGDREFDETGGAHKARKPHASMGKQAGKSVDPKGYLRKGAAAMTQSVTAAGNNTRPDGQRIRESAKPGVPRKTEKPVMGLTSDKNFIVSNAVDNIVAVPKRAADTSKNYTTKRDYGQVPSYLQKIKEDTQRARAESEVAQRHAEQAVADNLVLMSPEERDRLIAQLTKAWTEMNRKYQTGTFTVDTVTKVARKEQQEKTLDKLEKVLARLKSKRCLYVYDDVGQGFERLGLRGVDLFSAQHM